MKKRLFGLLCVLCMVLSLVPVITCAADPASGGNYQYNTTVVDHCICHQRGWQGIYHRRKTETEKRQLFQKCVYTGI